MSAFMLSLLQLLLFALWLLILGRVIASFVDPRARHPLSAAVVATTEPLLAPVRRLLPSTGMIDFSPLVVMLVLSALVRVVA